jgi:integrase
LKQFLTWLNKRTGWGGVGPRELLLRQIEANSENPYLVLDLLQEFLNQRRLAKKTNERLYTAVRSFFEWNRVPLPRARFKIRGFKPPATPKLTYDDVRAIIQAANLRDRSLILVKWMALMDNEEVARAGREQADSIVRQLKDGQVPVRINCPGRKATENEVAFYTFFGKDAVDALVEYFEKERGWPRAGEPIWPDKFGKPLSVAAVGDLWLRLTRRIGRVPKRQGSVGIRYGYNTHECRDIARSLLHTRGHADNFDLDCAEFWMGHTSRLDPNKYDKFYMDQEYMRSQYKLAEKYLNIISGTISRQAEEKTKEQISLLQEQVKELYAKLTVITSATLPDEPQTGGEIAR